MIDLTTKYLGLTLKNPIIAGSCGLTNSLENIKKAAENGAGAIVLKSIFEEQIQHYTQKIMQESEDYDYPEAADYIKNYTQTQQVEKYLTLIKEAKSAVDVPIIASVNCVTGSEWTSFAKKIELSGADALELNIFVMPSNADTKGEKYEKIYFDIIEKVSKEISIPIAVKMSYYFSGLAEFIKRLSWTDIKGIVLFNRFFSPDIDIKKLKIKSTNMFSTADELSLPLRWVAMMSGNVRCDLSASTGVHSSEAIIKQLLAGADTVQVASVLYEKGLEVIKTYLDEIKNWMEEHQYEKIADFRGKMSYKNIENPAAYERVQFMKHFSGIE